MKGLPRHQIGNCCKLRNGLSPAHAPTRYDPSSGCSQNHITSNNNRRVPLLIQTSHPRPQWHRTNEVARIGKVDLPAPPWHGSLNGCLCNS
ncbi:hypothetical protein AVEN_85484-1 [Araneus ventricosus]|uniref:Uncharacterized protein n=1 Tax=Araneus ventricosus TaxID=182803 RepID=A0A4Y2X8W3_ARAVE|nr:hypothetical protein AVEN_85484-1 [Araneus ventricosus]